MEKNSFYFRRGQPEILTSTITMTSMISTTAIIIIGIISPDAYRDLIGG